MGGLAAGLTGVAPAPIGTADGDAGAPHARRLSCASRLGGFIAVCVLLLAPGSAAAKDTIRVPIAQAGDLTIVSAAVKADAEPTVLVRSATKVPASVSFTASVRRTGAGRFSVLVVLAHRAGVRAAAKPGKGTAVVVLELKPPAQNPPPPKPKVITVRKYRDLFKKQKPTELPKDCKGNIPNPLVPLKIKKIKLKKPGRYFHPLKGVGATAFQTNFWAAGECWRAMPPTWYSWLEGVSPPQLSVNYYRQGSGNFVYFQPFQLTPAVGVFVLPNDPITAVESTGGFSFKVVNSKRGSWNPNSYALGVGPFQPNKQHGIAFKTQSSAMGHPTEATKIVLMPPNYTAVQGPTFEVK